MIDASITSNESPLSWETELETAIDLVEGILDDYYEQVTHNIAVRLQEHDLDSVAELFGETKTLDTLRSTLQNTQDAMLNWVRAHHDEHGSAEDPMHEAGQFRREWYERIKPHLQTPMRAFLCPVLDTLSHHAPMKRKDLLLAMEPLVRPMLNHRDQELLQRPQIARWHNTVTHTLLRAEEHQLVTKVVRGYWEITPQGEAYLFSRCVGPDHTDQHRVAIGTVRDHGPDLRGT